MKKMMYVLLVLVVAMSACHKKAKEEALRKERQKVYQDNVFKNNLATLGPKDTDWITWYLSNNGLKAGEMQILTLQQGTGMKYLFQDTLRTGILPQPIIAPKVVPGKAVMANQEKSVIDSSANTVTNMVLFETFPNPAPVSLVIKINKSELLLGGSIYAQDIQQKWFFFDIPGTIADLKYFSDPGDVFYIAEDKLPALRAFVYTYLNNGKGDELAKYLITKEGQLEQLK